MDWGRLLIASLLFVAFVTLVNQADAQTDATATEASEATEAPEGGGGATSGPTAQGDGAGETAGTEAPADAGATQAAGGTAAGQTEGAAEGGATAAGAATTAAPPVVGGVTGGGATASDVTESGTAKSDEGAISGTAAAPTEAATGKTETEAGTESAETESPAIVVTESSKETEKPEPPKRVPDATYKVTTIAISPYFFTNETEGGYQGYIVDLLDKMEELMNVDFDIRVVSDGNFGKKIGEKWNGMIGEVIDGEADLAAAPITVTSEREKVVDFTYPIMSISAAALTLKRHPLRRPRIESLDDMVHNDFNFGVVKGNNIHRWINASKEEMYQKILKNIEDNGRWMANNDDGVHMARGDPKFAFLMESSSARHTVKSDPCHLSLITTDIYKRKYALAVQNQSPLRDKFNDALTELQQVKKELQKKWFDASECSGSFISCSIVNIAALSLLALYMLK